ncbi:MAG TPA: alpha/beta fold hydrolase, partial [Aggregatilineales bacterium]|nr:alpha/beta fold hydrolase [Aggregatilineales bacterium]
KRPWCENKLIGDPLMDERLLWFMGHAWEGMSDLGECLDTASRIQPGDSESWMREWFATADRLCAVADNALARGHKISAGETYLRACSYYLAGLIYSEQPGADIRRRVLTSADCFQKALDLLSIPGQAVEIPYEDSALPAYFFRAPGARGKAPVLIVHQGMDASVEEDLFLAQGAIKRGYHCLLLHHPGQGLALRDKGLTFRPDWENVITPVIDFLVKRPEVDADRIILMGLSFGGALVTRAGAFEKRIAICIANPAVYSWWDFLSGFLFGGDPELARLLETDPDAFNRALADFLTQAPAMYTWWVKSASWKFGASSPADLLNKLKQYTNADIAHKVTCKMLVMDGEGEIWAAQQARKLYDALNCPKDYMLFTAQDTGLLHCQTGAMASSSQRLFDWLDENI